ncbi:MAG: nicotinate-nucleotide adenylyltransferase [Planctomycetota bacterium]
MPDADNGSECVRGLLGGTFDPVHNGHLHLARHAAARFGLDGVLFMPARTPPHKPGRRIAPADHRLAMLRRAVADAPAFRVSDRELRRPGPSYTVDTLRALRETEPAIRYRLLLGSDMLGDLHKWREVEAVLRLGEPIVAARPGGDLPPDHPVFHADGEGVAVEEAAAWLRTVLAPPLHPFAAQLAGSLLPLPPAPVSSTEVRRRCRAGEPLDGLVPPAVAAYLRDHRLYTGDPETD